MKRKTFILPLAAAVLLTAAMFSDTGTEVSAASPESVSIDEAHFPDSNFRDYLSMPERDLNQNGSLEAVELAQITTLTSDTVENSGLYYDDISMNGYQYLTSLKNLELHIMMEDNPAQLMKLDFSSLPDLRILKVDTAFPDDLSSPVSLDLTRNSSLKELSVSCDCSISALPEECSILKYSIACWYYEECTVSHNHPENEDNLLGIIKHIPTLQELDITNIQKLSPDTSHNPELKKLTVSGIDNDPLLSLDLTSNYKLTDLTLYSCKLNQYTLDLSACTELNNLTLELLQVKRASSENGLSFLDLGKCHARNAKIDELFTDAVCGGSGYLNLKDIPNWNPDRLKETGRFYEEDSKLFPVIDTDENDSRESGTIVYYLDEDKTLPVICHIYMANVYSPEMVTGLEVTASTETTLTCKWNPVKRPHDGYVLYAYDSETDEKLQRVPLPKEQTSATLEGLTPGKRYKIVIRAFKRQGKQNYYSAHYIGNIVCETQPGTSVPAQ